MRCTGFGNRRDEVGNLGFNLFAAFESNLND